MTEDDLLAQMNASFEVERLRIPSLQRAVTLYGEAAARAFWHLAWINGYRAGLQLARDAVEAPR